MRRIDVFGIGFAVLGLGGALYLVFKAVGFDSTNAGIWSQAIFIALLVIWVLSYVFRAATGNMTYNRQLDDYEDAVLQKRLETLSPEELANLQRQLEQAESAADAPKSDS